MIALCAYCEQSFPASALHRDHVVPMSRGGPDTPDNLVMACGPCNLAKSDRLPSEWYAEIGRRLIRRSIIAMCIGTTLPLPCERCGTDLAADFNPNAKTMHQSWLLWVQDRDATRILYVHVRCVDCHREFHHRDERVGQLLDVPLEELTGANAIVELHRLMHDYEWDAPQSRRLIDIFFALATIPTHAQCHPEPSE